ncbi:MAG: YfiR family protein [Acidobacteria bacterium]|nr:YfiR family protein [Acidobacteriota bacterium]
MSLAGLLGTALLTAWVSAAAEPLAIVTVRATFVYNLVRFTTWPVAGPSESSDLRLCTLGADAVADALVAMAPAQRTNARGVVVRRLDVTSADATACHVLYVGTLDGAETRRAVDDLKDLPVLTVGESDAFLKDGGAASLVLERESMRIAVNPYAVRRAGLVLSSRLLSLARIINGQEADPGK